MNQTAEDRESVCVKEKSISRTTVQSVRNYLGGIHTKLRDGFAIRGTPLHPSLEAQVIIGTNSTY